MKNPREKLIILMVMLSFFAFCPCSIARAQEQETGIIIDNGSSGTSYQGAWIATTVSGSYGSNSLYGYYDSKYAWHSDLPQSGRYKVYMWWTQSPTRMTYAPVTITHSGRDDTVFVDQTINAGKWNLLGIYSFDNATGGTVTIKSLSADIYTTCADAVKFVYISKGTPPVAYIDSISPNPAAPSSQVKFSGHGMDPNGKIAGYSWRSSIDGVFNDSAAEFTKTNLSAGKHTIYFKVQDNDGNWSEEASTQINIDAAMTDTEHIYISLGYSPSVIRPDLVYFFKNIGATKNGQAWVYKNAKGKIYFIHLIDDGVGFKRSLMTENAHVIFVGHSNFSIGLIFCSEKEIAEKSINNLRYMNDERLEAYGSKNFRVNLQMVRKTHSFPLWWPKFKDGTSAIMPYDFNDPDKAPPYNYYLTYQVAKDPNYYKMETARNSAIQRFPESLKPAWYSATGLAPDPSNPDHRKYFLTNTSSFVPNTEISGNWTEDLSSEASYYGTYHWSNAGSGENQFRFNFTISTAGNYNIYSWWPAMANNSKTSCYTINHNSINSVVYADQSIKGKQWNLLGQYYFDKGSYWVLVDNDTLSGNVIADAIRIRSVDQTLAKIVDNVSYPKTHYKGFVIISRGDQPLSPDKFKYTRLFNLGCLTGICYNDTFHRGKMFYALNETSEMMITVYLKYYLEGNTDAYIWKKMQAVRPGFDYYDFDKRPTEQE